MYRDYHKDDFHIATHHWAESDRVQVILRFRGQIVDTRVVECAEDLVGITDEHAHKQVLKRCIVSLHREFYERLFDGCYDARLAQIADAFLGGGGDGPEAA